MTLRIRQIVLAARELEPAIAQLQDVLGVRVCFRDPAVSEFGLHNALMTIGPPDAAQFLEVVSPTREQTAAGRHLERLGDSGYMLILQTDDFVREQARFKQLGVRLVWQVMRPDISAAHLHPKDIGAAIVSVDQPAIKAEWPWAGPEWRRFASSQGAQRVMAVTIAALDPRAMAQRWAEVLGTSAPVADDGRFHIDIEGGVLKFVAGRADTIAGFMLAMPDARVALAIARERGLTVNGAVVTMGGVQFELVATD